MGGPKQTPSWLRRLELPPCPVFSSLRVCYARLHTLSVSRNAVARVMGVRSGALNACACGSSYMLPSIPDPGRRCTDKAAGYLWRLECSKGGRADAQAPSALPRECGGIWLDPLTLHRRRWYRERGGRGPRTAPIQHIRTYEGACLSCSSRISSATSARADHRSRAGTEII